MDAGTAGRPGHRMLRGDIGKGHGRADSGTGTGIGIPHDRRTGIARGIQARDTAAAAIQHATVFVTVQPTLGIEIPGLTAQGVKRCLLLIHYSFMITHCPYDKHYYYCC